jgi:hypothetical protein
MVVNGVGKLLLLAVSGGADHRRWCFFDERDGTTVAHFYDFIRYLLEQVGLGTPGIVGVLRLTTSSCTDTQLFSRRLPWRDICISSVPHTASSMG